MSDDLALLRARVAPGRIAFVKFIMEAYDGLAVLSTIDRHQGEVLFRYHPATHEELLALLNDLRVDYGHLHNGQAA
ncbi:MAG TPA: DUF4911 domain-containing protein [Desulfurivibrionaceae bacterium]|nr:DUF4911 domain-containing protein [Desulfurivibrionaceae bacterium]